MTADTGQPPDISGTGFQHVSSGPSFRLTTKPTRGFNSSNIMVNDENEADQPVRNGKMFRLLPAK